MTFSPTPPQPTTATVWPACTRAVLVAAPTPVMTLQPTRAAASMGTSSGTCTRALELTSCCSAKADMPAKLGDGLAVHAESVLAAEAVGVDAEEGASLDAVVAVAAGGDEGDDDAVADLDVGNLVADPLDDAGRLVDRGRRGRPWGTCPP